MYVLNPFCLKCGAQIGREGGRERLRGGNGGNRDEEGRRRRRRGRGEKGIETGEGGILVKFTLVK